jgi:hypothetical protein
MGIGTPLVESLTSYVSWIAEQHCVSNYVLVSREIGPLLDKAYLHTIGNYSRLGSSIWQRIARTLNGPNKTTGNWVSVLQALTLRDDLQYLTMLPWSGSIAPRNLIRREQAWCPICYEE